MLVPSLVLLVISLGEVSRWTWNGASRSHGLSGDDSKCLSGRPSLSLMMMGRESHFMKRWVNTWRWWWASEVKTKTLPLAAVHESEAHLSVCMSLADTSWLGEW